MADIEQLLRQGIAAVKAGKRAEARQALMQVLEADERNEQAWLWLASVVDTPEDQRVCLENVLELSPGNQYARRGLAWLDQQHPAAAPADADAPSADTTDPAPAESDRQLSYDGKTPLKTRPKDPVPKEPGPASEDAPAEYACPYCGTPTLLNQRACPRCRRSLMVRNDPPAKRKLATTILGILWGLNGVLIVLSGIAMLCGGIFLATQLGPTLEMEGQSIPGVFWVLLAVPLLFGGLYIVLARGLLQRQRWAYVVNAFLAGMSVIGMLCNIAQGAVLMASIPQMVDEIEASAGPLPEGFDNIGGIIGAYIGVALLISVVIVVIHVLLTVLSYRDFFTGQARLVPEVEAHDDIALYNAGVAFKNQGMWYMAAKAWEGAAKVRPRDANYRHALGLAYAQLQQFDQALPTLQEALKLAPDDTGIQQSISLVEQQVARKR